MIFFLRFEEATHSLLEMNELVANKEWESSLIIYQQAKLQLETIGTTFCKKLPQFLRTYTAGSILTHIISLAAEVYEKIKDYKKATSLLQMLIKQDTYLLDWRGRWYDRLALDLQQHLKQPKQVAIKNFYISNIADGLLVTRF